MASGAAVSALHISCDEVLFTHGDDVFRFCLLSEKEVCSDVILGRPANLSENLERGFCTLYLEWQCVACLGMNGERSCSLSIAYFMPNQKFILYNEAV